MSGFDFGATVDTGGMQGQPDVGNQSGRVKSIFHLGLHRPTFQGEVKAPVEWMVIIFELHDQSNEEDGVKLTTYYDFPLRFGKKANMSKVMSALNADGSGKNWGDFIGKLVSLNMEGGKEKDEAGNPKHVNVKSLSAPSKSDVKIAELEYPELSEEGSGYLKFDELTKEALGEMHQLFHVKEIIMASPTFKEEKVYAVIQEILKENPDAYSFGESTKSEKEEPLPDEAPPEMEDYAGDQGTDDYS